MSRRLPRLRCAAALLTAGLLAGCSTAAPMPGPSPDPSLSEAPAVVGDGTLRLGALLALRDSAAGAGQLAAVHAALRQVNLAGGALDRRVELISRDAAADPADFDAAVAELVDRGVDAIVGPADPQLAERAARIAAEAGIPVMGLAAAPESAAADGSTGLLFSAVPGGDRRAALLGRLIPAEGAVRVALVHDDSAEGTRLAETLGEALAEHGGELVAVRRIAPDTSIGTVSALAVVGADAVVLAVGGEGERSREVITALAAVGLAADRLWLTGAAGDAAEDLDDGVLEGAHAVTDGVPVGDELRAALRHENPGARSFARAAEAYDATVMIVLAARLADDDAGPALAAALRRLDGAGTACGSFGECAVVVADGRDPAYEGASGPFSVDALGQRVSGGFGVGVYRADNTVEVASSELG